MYVLFKTNAIRIKR